MRYLFTLALLAVVFAGCNNATEENDTAERTSTKSEKREAASGGSWKGHFSNGMKGATISFDVEGDELQNLTFEGYWRCEGKLDLTTLGPEASFPIKNGIAEGVIIEPEDGPAPFRYELHGRIDGDKAEGTLRIINGPAGCDTYKLNWTAEKQ